MSTQVSPSLIVDSTTNDPYLLELLNQFPALNTEGLDTQMAVYLQSLRDRATVLLSQSPFPTIKDEEWRFTDLSSLRQLQFKYPRIDVDTQSLNLSQAADTRLVFVNGVFAPSLSALSDLPDGVIVTNLAGLSARKIQSTTQYLAQSLGSEEVFTSLNTAGMQDVAVVWVKNNIIVQTPIYLVFLTTSRANPAVCLPRCLVVAETNSQVTLIEEYTNHKDTEEQEIYLNNAVTEIWIEENAQVNHTRLQIESKSAFHIGKSVISQGRFSRYICNALSFGSRLSRHNLEIIQQGEQTETILNGLTMIDENQLADTHSVISLNYPYSTSKQLHKCIVGDRARSVFNGKIFVPKAAQLTDASQLNRNLLLSPKARVDTKPQLEITADNVKCAHGATVSQLEDDEIFYLQSRGIDENDARHLLIKAFATEIINQIPVESIKERLRANYTG